MDTDNESAEEPAGVAQKKRISTSSAFGGAPIVKGRNPEDRLNDLSGVPEGFPKPSKPGSSTDDKLRSILDGEVPK